MDPSNPVNHEDWAVSRVRVNNGSPQEATNRGKGLQCVDACPSQDVQEVVIQGRLLVDNETMTNATSARVTEG